MDDSFLENQTLDLTEQGREEENGPALNIIENLSPKSARVIHTITEEQSENETLSNLKTHNS
jgi:hypothetical protein